MTVDPTKAAQDINLDKNEIMNFEPLHDITNIVSNILTELPSHIPEIQKELVAFRKFAMGDNKQLSGSKARLTAVKLVKFIHQKFEEGKVQQKILDLVSSLVEIISICYSRKNSDHRSKSYVSIIKHFFLQTSAQKL